MHSYLKFLNRTQTAGSKISELKFAVLFCYISEHTNILIYIYI